MKYITFTVPCYNSAAYMQKCIESLLPAGRDVEIIIVNDGSTDGTAAIADAYAERYPNIVRVIHKENGGHGSGVNAGLENAKGLYFKVVDSDDWVDLHSLRRLLGTVKYRHERGQDVDLYLSNYVYEHVDDGVSYSVGYKNVFPKNRQFSWCDVGQFRTSQFLTMHAMTYRTELLRECGLRLPEHTFYVDNIFIMHPLPYVDSMFYINIDFYRYFIGRADQSVNEAVIMKRINQQERVARILIEDYIASRHLVCCRKLDRYLVRHIGINASIVSVFQNLKNTEESFAELRVFWNDVKDIDPTLYRRLRTSTVAALTDLPGPGGRFIVKNGYRISQKLFKFN